jgi:pyrroline-5-carboxylate reductase
MVTSARPFRREESRTHEDRIVGGGTALINVLGSGFSRPTSASSSRAQARHSRQFGVAARFSGAWLGAADVIVLAVKPQQMHEAASSVRPYIAQPLVLSIAAGVRSAAIARWLGTNRIARAMPNTPALIRSGISGLAATAAVSADQRAAASRILESVGKVVWVDDESMLDPVTAISGSGPAYVFYFIEALQQAGRELGCSEEQSRALAIETFVGAARLAAQSAEPASVLRERVTSKGGTTAAALASLERCGVRQAIVDAVKAANARANELGADFDR